MRRTTSQSQVARARTAVSRAHRRALSRTSAVRRRGHGRRRHGPLPKIIALVLTSVVTIGMVAWALIPHAPEDPIPPAKAVFLGDSYTAGIGGDGPDWPTVVSADLGWSVVNLAAGGTGYATAAGVAGCGKEHCGAYLEQSMSITDDPDIIVVAGGRNDPGGSIAEAALKLFMSLRERYPGAEVVALSPWADDDPPDEAFALKTKAVHQAAEEAGITYIDTGQPFVGHPELMSADGIHPNTAGYLKLTTLLTPMLAEATGYSLVGSGRGATALAAERRVRILEALRSKKWPEIRPALESLGDDARVSEWAKDSCLDVDDRNVGACAYGPQDSAELVALMGDSHAISFMPTLRAALPGRRIQSLTLQQCPAAAVAVQRPTSQGPSPYPECDDHRTWADRWLKEHKPKTVVIVDAWDTPTRMPGDDAVAKLRDYKAALTSLTARLTDEGMNVVVIASPPPGENLVACRTAASTPVDCVRTMPSSYTNWTKVSADAVSQADASAAVFVRTDSWFCSSGSCPAFIDGVTTFADGNHLTDDAARAVGPLLAQNLSAQ